MSLAAPVFAVLAVALAGPVPALLAKARWTYRAPRAALVLWQSVTLAAVLSAFSSGLAIASELLVPGPDGRPTTSPAHEIQSLGLGLWLAYVLVFALTLVVGARLMYSALRVAVRTRRRRAHHRMLVDLLDRGHFSRRGSEIRVLAAAEPIAYCLPGIRGRVVFSEGTLATLTDTELAAVLAHERCHLRARHDLVLEAFTAVHDAFPRVVRSASALDSVALLIEMLADDTAVKADGPAPLARALVACSSSTAPRGALAAGGTSTVLRISRLTRMQPSAGLATGAYLAAALIMLVPTIAVALPWLVELNRLRHSL